MGPSLALADNGMSDLLMPLWQVLIGVLVLVTVVVAGYRIFMRGPSRMGGAMLLAGGAVVGLAVVGYLVQLL